MTIKYMYVSTEIYDRVKSPLGPCVKLNVLGFLAPLNY